MGAAARWVRPGRSVNHMLMLKNSGAAGTAARRSIRGLRAVAIPLAAAGLVAVSSCTSREVVGVVVGSVQVQPSTVTVLKGDSVQLIAVVRDEAGSILEIAPVEWSTQGPAVAAVSPTGVVSGLDVGSTTIYATFGGVLAEARITVVFGPTIESGADSLVFRGEAGGAAPAARTVQISYDAGGIDGLTSAVAYSEGEPAGWLSAELVGTSTPTTLTVAARTAALGVGWYQATVHVTASPDHALEIPVTLSLASITITETDGGSEVDEGGGTDQLLVVLDVAPTANVLLNVSADDPSELAVSPSTLTFTPGNWNVPQAVTATGMDDPLVDGDVVTRATVSVNAGSDPLYAPVSPRQVEVTTLDDDGIGIVVTEIGGTRVSENGSQLDEISIALQSPPTATVVLDLSSGDPGEFTVAPTRLTFSPASALQPQPVTVAGVNDDFVDGHSASPLVIAVDRGATLDPAYDALPSQSILVTTTDDDVAGFALADTSNLVVNERGTTDAFRVVLNARPLSSVVLDVLSADPDEVTVSAHTLTFTPSNWNQAQTVTVTGVRDGFPDGNQTVPVTISVDASQSNDLFDHLAPRSVSVTNVDRRSFWDYFE